MVSGFHISTSFVLPLSSLPLLICDASFLLVKLLRLAISGHIYIQIVLAHYYSFNDFPCRHYVLPVLISIIYSGGDFTNSMILQNYNN